MLSRELCLERRRILRERLKGQLDGPLVLSDPIHLRYLANSYVDPFSLGADFGGVLAIESDGTAKLFHDSRVPKSVESSCVEERIAIKWYDGKSAAAIPRRLALLDAVRAVGGRLHDSLGDPMCETVQTASALMRRQKFPDEIEQLKACMKIGEAGHAWARGHVREGMTELQVYEGIFAACAEAAGEPVILYGDFAVSPGSAKRGGSPTTKVLAKGDMLILDFSAILGGYRSDFTNTLVIGGEPTKDQQMLMDLSKAAMAAGEASLKAGVSCKVVYDAVRSAYGDKGQFFPHHAGHGLGIQHPEAPFLVEKATETLMEGDVVTLEPGLYIDGIGGVRIEHNYLITKTGYERLSNHFIGLV